MITEYHRPESLEQALKLLAREGGHTLPLGGGTKVNRPSKKEFEVVDLQRLGLDELQVRANNLELGATLTLGNLLARAENGDPELPDGLVEATKREGSYNLRQVSTVAGALVGAGGRSSFAVAMLALDATLTLQPGDERLSLGDLLPLRSERLGGRLITTVSIPRNVKVAYEYIARSPADLPVVAAGMAFWPSGRIRLTLGGYGGAPSLAFDGA